MKEIKTYVDEVGREVLALLDVDAKTLEFSTENILFKGRFKVETNMGPMPLGFNFPEGHTLDKCFEEFDEQCQKTIDNKNEELKKQKEQEEQEENKEAEKTEETKEDKDKEEDDRIIVLPGQ